MSRLGWLLAAGTYFAILAVVGWALISVNATNGALIVAALSVLSNPVSAWLTFQWTRQSELERWTRERQAEAERFGQEEKKRRVLRGEEAAKEILTTVDDAQTVLSSAPHDGPFGDTYKALRPLFYRIRQQAELLTNDEAQARIMKIADNLYFFGNSRELNDNLSLGQIGHTCSDATHKVLRAYLQGQPLPSTPRMDVLQGYYDEGYELNEERYGDDDPLRPPTRSLLRSD